MNIEKGTTWLFAYLPVIHRGHRELFAECRGGVLHILGSDIVSRWWPHLARDIRALSPEEVAPMAAALGIFRDVCIVTRSFAASCSSGTHEELDSVHIVMPDESEMREFAERYFPGRAVEFHSVFLRWHRAVASRELPPSADRKVSREDVDREFMTEAYRLGEKSPDWWRRVGVLAVRNGRVILSSHNRHFPTSHTASIDGDPRSDFEAGERIDLSLAVHGEIGVIAEAAREGFMLAGVSVYTSTFPCPPCARALAVAGVRRVYYADGYSLLDAEKILRDHGVEIVQVVL